MSTKHLLARHGRLGNHDDEFYTPWRYCVDELNWWGSRGFFRGKSIICPCDWPGGPYTLTPWEWPERISGTSAFFKAFVFHPEWGYKSATFSGLSNDGGISMLDVDFTKYDILITNPPFSKYRDLIDKIADSGIDYLLVAPFSARHSHHYSRVDYHLGHNIYKNVAYARPDGSTKLVMSDWITSFPDAQIERNATLPEFWSGVKFNAQHAKWCDDAHGNPILINGYKLLDVDRLNEIPDDYDGWIAAPITLFNKFPLDGQMPCRSSAVFINGKNCFTRVAFRHAPKP